MQQIVKEMSKEKGHWYDKDGNPAYTIVSKKGDERPTTLRDAKKLNLLPSVTSIIRLAASPGLQIWRDTQLLMSALTCTRLPDEPEADYIARIIKDAGEQSAKARELGTQIHAWVQSGFENAFVPPEGMPFYENAKNTLLNHCGEIKWICEKSFATETYGGKVDLQGFNQTGSYIIDIKTTEKDLETIKTWPEHSWQLAAYDYEGVFMNHGILYVNSIIAESKLIIIGQDEIDKGRKCFNALLNFFYAKNGL